MMNNAVLLNDDVLIVVTGGQLVNPPTRRELEEYGVSNIVRVGGWSMKDQYYATYRGHDINGNEIWKTVGSEDMLRYVEIKLGAGSPVYKRFAYHCTHEMPYIDCGII